VSQRWKLVAIGILTVGATSLASTLTTAYLLRPPAAPPVTLDDPDLVAEPESRPPIVRVAPPRRRGTPTPKVSPVPPPPRTGEIAPAPGPRRPAGADEGAIVPATAVPPTGVLMV
jgi:hypothetical protein